MTARGGGALLGALAVVLGAALLGWGLLAPEHALRAPVAAAGAPWFVWAVAAAGTSAGLLAVALAPALRPARPRRWLRLPGSGRTGRLTLDLASVVAGLAQALGDTVGVASARGHVVTHRGRLVLEVALVVDERVDLLTLAEATERVTRDVRAALDGLPVTHRVLVRTAR